MEHPLALKLKVLEIKLEAKEINLLEVEESKL
jgi:hypothetical protein